MQNLGKSLSNAFLVLAGGIGAWLGFVTMATESAMYVPPAALVIVMALFIIAFAAVAFGVHTRSVAGVPFEDSQQRRRPSLVIPSVSTIALMIFIVGYAGSHSAFWTLTSYS